MNSNIFIGIDGGGTYTRVAISDTEGNLLSYVEKEGASSRNKDLNAKANVQQAIHEALYKSGRTLNDVVSLGAGIAGLDSDEDLVWVRELTRMDGLTCPARHVNDAVTAHAGAFLLAPGVIAISSTGSIIFGITESGRHIRNYDFQHYATAARFLSFDVIHKIIAGEIDQTDNELVNSALEYFTVEGVRDLAMLGSEGFISDKRDRMKLLGGFAPRITELAERGSNLAMGACGRAAEVIITGIRLIGACFDQDTVSVALIGGVANSPYIKNTITRDINNGSSKRYILMEPSLPPALGAILLAMEHQNIAINDEKILANLKKGAACGHL